MWTQVFEQEEVFTDSAALRQRFGTASVDLQTGGRLALIGQITLCCGVAFAGDCRLVGPALVDVGSVLTEVSIGSGATVRPYSVINDFVAGERALLGPFCFIRNGCKAGNDVILGAHVEATRSVFASGVKVSHRAFIGDAEIGQDTIIGAGVVFCNYDKGHRRSTTIGSNVVVGSGTMVVAPITIGDGAIIGAGSTLTRSLPAHSKLIQRR